MMKSIEKILNPRVVFFVAIFWIIASYFLLPHYVELTGALETWLPYKGLILYKQAHSFHFPLGRYILLPIHLAANWNLEYDPILALLFGTGSLFLIYKFGKRYLHPLSTSVSLLFFAIYFWYAATGILFFHEILIGFLLGVAFIILLKIRREKSPSINLLLFQGLVLSTNLFSGQISGITVVVLAILTVWEVIRKKVGKKALISLLAGLILPGLVLSIYFLSRGALYEFFYYNVLYYFQYAGYSEAGTSLPWNDLLAFYFPSLVLAVAVLKKLVVRKQIPYLSGSALLVSLSTIPFMLTSVYHPHHLNYALVISAMTLGVALRDSLSDSKSVKVVTTLGIAYIGYMTLTTYIPWHTSRFRIPENMRIANDLYPDDVDPMNDAVTWVKENTNQDDQLMVIGDAMFYLRSDRLPASRPSKGIPYSWNPLSEVIIEIRQSPADYWVVDTNFIKRLEEIYQRFDITGFIEEELDNCYKLREQYEIWQIWERDC